MAEVIASSVDGNTAQSEGWGLVSGGGVAGSGTLTVRDASSRPDPDSRKHLRIDVQLRLTWMCMRGRGKAEDGKDGMSAPKGEY